MRRWRRAKKGILFFLFAVVAGATIVFGYQPHIFQALREGFPAPVWPAEGAFTTVNGQADKPLINLSGRATSRLSKLLEESGSLQFVVLHKGKIVLERSFEEFASTSKFNSYSMVKSLVGFLVLKAIADKKISGINAPLGQYLTDVEGTSLGSVQIADFLDMKSGVQFEETGLKAASVRQPKDLQESFANPFGPMVRLHMRGLEDLAGNLRFDESLKGQFNYQNINTSLLAVMLEEVYGTGIEKLLEHKIWRPAGASTAFWRKHNKSGSVSAYCCLYASARDWAVVGHFLAQNGNGKKKFLPEPLFRKLFGFGLSEIALNQGVYANHARYDILNRKGEKLQGPFTYFMGHNGQVLYLMPQHDLVVVRFGKAPQLLHSTLYEVWKSINLN